MFLISDGKLPCDKAFLKLYFAYAIIKLAIFTDPPLGWVADLYKMHNLKWIDERVTVFAKDFCNATRHLIMSTNHLAKEFLFQRIREMLPPQVSLAYAISEILHVSNDRAYQRIRNET